MVEETVVATAEGLAADVAVAPAEETAVALVEGLAADVVEEMHVLRMPLGPSNELIISTWT